MGEVESAQRSTLNSQLSTSPSLITHYASISHQPSIIAHHRVSPSPRRPFSPQNYLFPSRLLTGSEFGAKLLAGAILKAADGRLQTAASFHSAGKLPALRGRRM